jgi:cyclase
MLARRVILSLLFVDGVLHRTKRFKADYRYTQAFSWAGDADELLLIDVTRQPSAESRAKFHFLVEKYCRIADLPMGVGGNVRSMDEAVRLLNLGCEKVLIGWGGRDLYEPLARRVGCQSVVAGVDYGMGSGGDWAISAVSEAKEAQARGAGEILLTSIERDGSLSGYDLPILREVVASVCVPVVVAGGCGSWGHVGAAFEAGASGAATSNIFHLNATAMRACKTWLAQNYAGPIRAVEAA